MEGMCLMPSVDTTEDADIVERHFSKWDALATIRRFIDRNGQVSFAVDCDDQQTKFAATPFAVREE